MKITMYYEDKNHPTILDVPDEECSVMVETDYQQRLAEAEDKYKVSRRTVQEIMDEDFSKPTFNRNHGKAPLKVDNQSLIPKEYLTVVPEHKEVNSEAFAWLHGEITPEKAKACQDFVGKLCEMARTQKRVTAKAKAVDNEKYAFRCFLLRLGLIGAEYKTTRKILMENLSGNASFKSGKKKEAEHETSE